jgi:hypothetical protein
MLDHRLVEGLMEAVAPIIMEVRDFSRKELDAARKEIAALRAELDEVKAQRPEKGEPGKDGRDAEVDLEALALKAAELIDKPKDGVNGKDADPVDLDAIAIKAAALIEKPKDGADGKDGRDAEVDVEALALKAAELIAVPKDGRDGIDGKDGRDGAEGTGIKDLLTDGDGNLVATLTNGEVKRVGRVVGRDGKDGEKGADGVDGKDGLGFDDMTAELAEDGRTVEIKMIQGERVKVTPIKFGVTLYQGVFSEAREQPYQKGDQVSYGGSMWIAQKDAPEGRPQDGNPSWKLAVKRGRDGKDGKAPPGPIGPVSVPAAKS